MSDRIHAAEVGLPVRSMTNAAQRLITWLGLDADDNGRIDGADLAKIDQAMVNVDLRERDPSQRLALASVRAVAVRAAELAAPRDGAAPAALAPVYQERFARLRGHLHRAATLDDTAAASVVTLLNACPADERARLAHDLSVAGLMHRLIRALPAQHDGELVGFVVDAARGLPVNESLQLIASLNEELPSGRVAAVAPSTAIDTFIRDTLTRVSQDDVRAYDVFNDVALLANLGALASDDTRAFMRSVLLTQHASTAVQGLIAVKGTTVGDVRTLLAKKDAIEVLGDGSTALQLALGGTPAPALRDALLSAAATTSDHTNGLAIQSCFGTARAADVEAHVAGLSDAKEWFLTRSTTDSRAHYWPSAFSRMARNMALADNTDGLAVLRAAAVKHVTDPTQLAVVLRELER